MGHWLIVAVLILLAVISGLFSGTETVLFSLSKTDRARMKKSGNKLEALAATLLDEPRALLTTLLIGNMTCNILIFVLSAILLGNVSGEHISTDWSGSLLVGLLALLPPLLVTYVSDIFPKVIGSLNNTRIAPWVALPVATLVRLSYPITRILDVAVLIPIHRLAGAKKEAESFSTDELRELLEMSEQQGVIDVSENELLQEIVRIGELHVRDVMTPRVDMVAYNLRAPQHDPPGAAYDRLIEIFRKTRLTKLPVYEGDGTQTDNVIGLIYAKTLLLEPDPRRADIRKLIQPVRFVPEFQSLEKLLTHFRKTKTQLAMVVDEYGSIVGLVTLEDVVEQMVGDLYLPFDAPGAGVQKSGPDVYIVPGDLSVADWMAAFGEPDVDEDGVPEHFDSSRVSTVAGVLASCLKRLPRQGDTVKFGHLRMTVEQMRGKRVERVRLELINGHKAEDAK
jgi:putative hemolysin